MASDADWGRAVEKLLALTTCGSLRWQSFPALASKRENIQGEAFRSTVQDRWIAVYEYRFKSYEEEEAWSWETEVAIEFVTFEGDLEWRWPAMPLRWELIDAIRGQVARAPDFLRNFLAEETTS